MILAADIGNTNIVLGVFHGDALCFTARLPSHPQQSGADYLSAFRTQLAELGTAPTDWEGAILSSVVPALTPIVAAALEALTGRAPLIVNGAFHHGLAIKNYDPTRLGSDRIVDAVAALARYPAPLAIFDLGTATTLSVLDREGAFIGGMILAGLRLGVDALSARGAQLPPVQLAEPASLLGIDTASCIQSGAIYGAAALLDGLTERVEEKLGVPVNLVVTGGLAGLVTPHCRHPLHYDEHLLLRGLYLLFQRNQLSD
ncbi:MAG: type III pantothenate kinase [Oscillospiraceae bacterium]